MQKNKTEYVTIESQTIEKGNDFIEIARKEARDGEKVTRFISIARGFIKKSGERKYRKAVSLPDDDAVLAGVVRGLRKIGTNNEATPHA